MTEKITQFLRGVKEGTIRGDYCREYVTENVAVEVSVGSFEMGYVHIRVFAECPEKQEVEGMYYRRLTSVSDEYVEARNSIVETIESENETNVENAHEWKVQREGRAEKLSSNDMFPRLLSVEETIVFDDHIQIRDDVSMAEALMTNREDGMTRTEIEDELEDLD